MRWQDATMNVAVLLSILIRYYEWYLIEHLLDKSWHSPLN